MYLGMGSQSSRDVRKGGTDLDGALYVLDWGIGVAQGGEG